MGKTAGGAVWLNAEMLAPYEFWQFWRNTTDADVGRFLKLYTELPVEECDRLGALGGAEINAAKITLANEVTALCHGAEAAAAAEATARAVFERGRRRRRAADRRRSSARDVPRGRASRSCSSWCARASCGSGKDARRLIAEGGARLDDERADRRGPRSTPATLAAGAQASAGRSTTRSSLAGLARSASGMGVDRRVRSVSRRSSP